MINSCYLTNDLPLKQPLFYAKKALINQFILLIISDSKNDSFQDNAKRSREGVTKDDEYRWENNENTN